MGECGSHLRVYLTSKISHLRKSHNLIKVSFSPNASNGLQSKDVDVHQSNRHYSSAHFPPDSRLTHTALAGRPLDSRLTALAGRSSSYYYQTPLLSLSNHSQITNQRTISTSSVRMGSFGSKYDHTHVMCACCHSKSPCKCDCDKSKRCLCAGPLNFHRKGVTQQSRWFGSGQVRMNGINLRGMTLLREPNINKDLAFTTRERELYGLKGLLPPTIRTQEMQVKIVMDNIRSNRFPDELSKYIYLRDLQDFNKHLFYRVLQEYTEELMPIVYTPIVGLACQEYSYLFKRPRGIFITVHDAGRIPSIFANWPEPEVKAIVVTDGERILGLGDLGANGMGIPVGKMALYSAIGGIPPELTLPIALDVGTNNETLLADPFYIGLKQKRVRGPEYDDLIDAFMEAVVQRWGRSCLVQFEDFGNANAFRLLEKYQRNYCTFNDDIQGTASVSVAGILASLKITGTKITQQTFLFQGAGEAALGTADLLVMAMEQEGMKTEDARKRIWLMDSKGLVAVNRPTGDIDAHKGLYAKKAEHTKKLEDVINSIKPSVLIGVSAQTGAFTETILRKVASFHERPIIFALSNPTSKSECTAEEAYTFTDGRCVFASGSPFDPVNFNGQTFIPGQGNNAYIFPAVALAVMACGVQEIKNEVFLVAARALAEQVTQEHLNEGRVYPPLKIINDTSLNIATKVAQWFYVEGMATHRPEPEDKYLFLKGKLYDSSYDGSSFNRHINPKNTFADDGIFTR